MSGSNRGRHTLCVTLCSVVGVLWNTASTCAASGRARDCSAVYEAAREQELAGHLHEATLIFQNCAIDSCSNPVRQTCQAKLFRLELDVPSVVPLVKDDAGEPIVDVQVTMDGRLIASRLDGRALSVDPGLHEFVFRADGSVIGRQRLVIAQGQRNRELWVALPALEGATTSQPTAAVNHGAAPTAELSDHAQASAARTHAEATPPRHVNLSEPEGHGPGAAPYLLGGTALLGAGAYVLMSTWARGDNRQLKNCSPNCSADSVSHIRSLYLAADISLGVAIASALGSAALFVFSGSGSKDESAPRRSFALAVQPERDGALATFRGSL
jgi:hypothetical protein